MNSIALPQPASTKAPPPSTRAALLAPYQFNALIDDPRLTALTDFAAQLCEVPTALVSLVEDWRQLFLARTGLDATETPRETSFCAHAMLGDDVMVVPDARLDPRFADNPLVTGPPHIRFYAGAPLHGGAGEPLGALCVIDIEPRDGLTPLQKTGLATLSQAVMTLFEAQRARIEQGAETATALGQRDEREQRFATLADSMPQMVWSTQPDGFHDYYNARWYEFTGVPPGSTDGEGWNGMFHPDDQERAWKRWSASLTSGKPYEIEYRLRHRDGDYRWVLGRALPMRDEAGEIIRWIGTCTDIHDQKNALAERELISHELSHRIKNIFSVISGLITLSGRERPEMQPIVGELRERIMALGRAHDFVRPHSEASRPSQEQSSLHGLLEQLLAPYQSADAQRIRISGDDVGIDDRSATPLALLFHELANNAAKYGALSAGGGTVTVATRPHGDQSEIEWVEQGGPVVSEAINSGFGSRLIAMSVERQLGGTIDRHWDSSGLRINVSLPLTAMKRA